ncbi:MAG: hypothetical protein IT422_15770 [Pirellulaceae bacterium]|nr:hypothetical protein [Pirellulaceae bacterium]
MTYVLTAKFLKEFPGPYDVRPSRDGVDDTFEIYCLTTGAFLAATYFWDAEQERYTEAMAVATALNYMFHEELVFEDGLACLKNILNDRPSPYLLSRDACEYRGGCWQVTSKGSDTSILQCYGAFMDYSTLSIALMVRHALTYADMYLPRERPILECAESELITF